MAVYFKAINDTGMVQISDTYNTIQLKRKGGLTEIPVLSAYYAPSGRGEGWTNLWGAMWIVPINAEELFCSITLNDKLLNNNLLGTRIAVHTDILLGKDGNRYVRIEAYSTSKNLTNNITILEAALSIYFWGYSVPSTENVGLRIFDANGKQIFHSSNKCLNVFGYYQDDAQGTTEGETITNNEGKILSFCCTQAFSYFSMQPFFNRLENLVFFYQDTVYLGGFRIPADMSWVLRYGTNRVTFPSYRYATNTPYCEYLVIDVTNF